MTRTLADMTHADHPQALGVVHQINDDLAHILEGGTP